MDLFKGILKATYQSLSFRKEVPQPHSQRQAQEAHTKPMTKLDYHSSNFGKLSTCATQFLTVGSPGLWGYLNNLPISATYSYTKEMLKIFVEYFFFPTDEGVTIFTELELFKMFLR